MPQRAAGDGAGDDEAAEGGEQRIGAELGHETEQKQRGEQPSEGEGGRPQPAVAARDPLRRSVFTVAAAAAVSDASRISRSHIDGRNAGSSYNVMSVF